MKIGLLHKKDRHKTLTYVLVLRKKILAKISVFTPISNFYFEPFLSGLFFNHK